LITIALVKGRGVHDVIDLTARSLRLAGKGEEGGGGVVTVDLVEKSPSVFLDDGGALQEAAEYYATTWAVEARQAGDRTVLLQDLRFGFKKQKTRFARRFGKRLFGDQGPVDLVINGCAGDEEEMRLRKGGEEVSGAVQENTTVGFGPSPVGGSGEDDGGWRFNSCSELFDLDWVGEVAADGTVITRSGEGGDVPARFGSLPGNFLAEVAVAGDEKVAIHLVNGGR